MRNFSILSLYLRFIQSRPDDLLLSIASLQSAKYIKQLHDFHHPVGGIHSEPFTEKDTYMNIIYVGLSILLLIHIHVPDNW
jgi:hypothetical protein